MGPLGALNAAGRQVIRQKNVLILYYLCNILAAAVVITPVFLLLNSVLGHSLESNRLFDAFDIGWAAETIRQIGPAAGTALSVTLGAVTLVYFLANTFLSGGAMSVFLDQHESFFAACARYFPRFLRLLLWSAPVYGIVLLLNSGIAKGLTRLSGDSMQEHTWIWAGWARTLVILGLLGIANLVIDYAKVILIAERRFGAFWALIDSFRFVRVNLGATLAIFFTGQLFGLLFLLAYHGLTEAAPQSSVGMLVLVFGLRQMYILAKLWTRLFVWSAELCFYDNLRAATWIMAEPVVEAPLEGALVREFQLPGDGGAEPAD